MVGRGRLRRAGVPAVLAAALLVGVAACTSGADPAAEPSQPSPSASTTKPEPATIRFAVYGDKDRVAAYRKLADAYTEEHPEVTVEVEASPDRVTAADRLDRQVTGGTAPDVFLVDHDQVPGLVADQRVRPVDQLLEQRGLEFGDNYQRLGLESMAADSALQCMPNDVSPYVVFYNRRLLDPRTVTVPDQDPPTVEDGWTWEQFVAAARQTSRGDVKGVYLPPRLTTLLPLVRSAGADLVDDPRTPTTLTFSDDGTRTALEQILTIARDPALTPTPQELAKQDAVTRFEKGRLAMMVGTRALVPRLRRNPDLRFDVLSLPKITTAHTVADITGYCIGKDSQHVEQAADLVAFASGEQGASILADTGAVVPANLAALHSRAFTQPGQFPRNVQVFSEAIRRADPMPFSPDWPRVVSQTQPFLDRLFYAPVLDLDTLLPRIDEVSASLLEQPTESPSP